MRITQFDTKRFKNPELMGNGVNDGFVVFNAVIEEETEFIIRIAVAVRGTGAKSQKVRPAVVLKVNNYIETLGAKLACQMPETFQASIPSFQVANKQFINIGVTGKYLLVCQAHEK